ncbi:hypothetical protein [Paenibacillus tepidiphilus]|uniref:hypothetical protein n=1 Tax=Paenibacillus tepidiphilus TaxID=2608683 RepID=UPI0012385349|nr:hypothetical protein [Paenibacillus tepidiphilus]
MAIHNNNGNRLSGGNNGNPLETEELSAEDLEIIAAGLAVLGEFFAFLALVKAREVTKSTGGQADIDPLLFVQSKKKAVKRKSRLPR